MTQIDPERSITLTLPMGMILKLAKLKQTLSMFMDDEDVKTAIDIIDAMQAGAYEFLQQEDGDLMDYLASGDRDDDLYETLIEKKPDEKK